MFEAETSPGPFAEPTGDTSSIDVDSLISQVESGQSERPMSAAEVTPIRSPEPQAPKPQAPEPTPPAAAEIEFTWNGKAIKAPATDPRIKQWASQGYDYAQRMQAFKQEQEAFTKQQEQIKALEARYREVEAYAEQNPDWWNHVQQSFQAARAQPGNTTDALKSEVLKALEEKLSPVQQFIQNQQIKEQTQAREAEDQALEADIKSVRDTYADLDWNGLDATGKTLEIRVLEHAAQNGISNFRAAFRDYQHDQLIKKAEERGKQQLVNERKAKTKLGLLGESPTPKKGITAAEDYKHKSYDDLLREGAEELGIAL